MEKEKLVKASMKFDRDLSLFDRRHESFWLTCQSLAIEQATKLSLCVEFGGEERLGWLHKKYRKYAAVT